MADVSRPILSICVRCEHGDDLHRRVRALRKERELKQDFKVDAVSCLGLCDDPCAVKLEGRERSTYLRSCLHPRHDVERIVLAARAYATLARGQELPERMLPGEHQD